MNRNTAAVQQPDRSRRSMLAAAAGATAAVVAGGFGIFIRNRPAAVGQSDPDSMTTERPPRGTASPTNAPPPPGAPHLVFLSLGDPSVLDGVPLAHPSMNPVHVQNSADWGWHHSPPTAVVVRLEDGEADRVAVVDGVSDVKRLDQDAIQLLPTIADADHFEVAIQVSAPADGEGTLVEKQDRIAAQLQSELRDVREIEVRVIETANWSSINVFDRVPFDGQVLLRVPPSALDRVLGTVAGRVGVDRVYWGGLSTYTFCPPCGQG